MACKIWTLPDNRHLRTLCTNEFRSENALAATSCSVCVTPVEVVPPPPPPPPPDEDDDGPLIENPHNPL